MQCLLIKNAKKVDKDDEMARLLGAFGGQSYVFMANGKKQE